MKSFLIGCFLILFAGISYSQNVEDKLAQVEKEIKKSPKDVQLLLNAGIFCHQLAMKDEDYIDKGETFFQKALSINPNLNIARAWYGSLLSIKGKYALMPWDKLKYVEKGLDQMDKAVKADRNDIAVRTVRGKNNLSLPKFFNRIDSAIVDLQYVVNKLESNKELQSKYNLAEKYLDLAKAYESKGQLEQSIKIWKKIRTAYPGTDEAQISSKKLTTLHQ